MSLIVGIDLGTSKVSVAAVLSGTPRVLVNAEGDSAIAAYVAYEASGEVRVGMSAKRQAITRPKNTVHAVKRLIGRRVNDKEVQRTPYKIVAADNGDAWVEINGRKLSPPNICAELLRKIKEIAEDYLSEEVTEAVIAVPAYFDDSQRRAVKVAGRIAGLDVTHIINEPTAAALAFGLDKHGRGDSKIAVYDLGGATFEISIIEIADVDGETQFEVLSTNGDTSIGGEDFDRRIIDYVAKEFKKEHGIDLAKDVLAMQRLWEAAERAKIELSDSTQTDVNLPYITADASGPKHVYIELTRDKLETLVLALVERTIERCRVAVNDAGLELSEIDDVILVGGMTRMPKVQQKVQEFFAKSPRIDVDPLEAVAIGAAIQGQLIGDEVVKGQDEIGVEAKTGAQAAASAKLGDEVRAWTHLARKRKAAGVKGQAQGDAGSAPASSKPAENPAVSESTPLPGVRSALRVFVSYSHQDEAHYEELESHLAVLRRKGLFQSWHDRKILPGEDWRNEIDKNLHEADLILLLISASFLRSDFCYEKEMLEALARHHSGAARVVPIIVRPCAWQESPFATIQVLPKDGKPITAHVDRDAAWTEVIHSLRKLA